MTIPIQRRPVGWEVRVDVENGGFTLRSQVDEGAPVVGAFVDSVDVGVASELDFGVDYLRRLLQRVLEIQTGLL